MSDRFVGVWVSEKNENYDEFLKAVGLGFAMRSVARTLSTTLDIRLDNNKFKIKSSTGPKTRELTFSIGEKIEDYAPSGKMMTGCWELDGDMMAGKFVEAETGTELVMRRKVEKKTLIQKMKFGETECTRYFKLASK